VLTDLAAGPVWIVKTWGHDWLPSISTLGWAYLLRKLDRVVQQAARESPTSQVTLIGHSAGGVLSRLYLSPRPFGGHAYCGLDYVERLITLGSPHYNRGGLTRSGTPRARWAYETYEQIGGDGNAWGDGLIPVQAALLSGAQPIVLEGVSHFTGFGVPWYGSREVIPLWWRQAGGSHV